MSINFDFEKYVREHQGWSLATFGSGDRTEAILKHIRKELTEIEANPSDLMEWVDVMILAIDGAWCNGHDPAAISKAMSLDADDAGVCLDDVGTFWAKALHRASQDPSHLQRWIELLDIAVVGASQHGHSIEAIAAALLEKQQINRDRQWPDWRTAAADQPIEHVREVS